MCHEIDLALIFCLKLSAWIKDGALAEAHPADPVLAMPMAAAAGLDCSAGRRTHEAVRQ